MNNDLSNGAKIWLSKSIFYVKNHLSLSQFFSIEEYQFRSTFFVIDILWQNQFLNHFINQMMPYFWQLAINPKLKTQNSIISFWHVGSYAKIFLIFYPPLENSPTRIAIGGSYHFHATSCWIGCKICWFSHWNIHIWNMTKEM